MWIVCLANDLHEMSGLIFSDNNNNNNNEIEWLKCTENVVMYEVSPPFRTSEEQSASIKKLVIPWKIKKWLDILSTFVLFSARETMFVTSCFVFCTTHPVYKGVYSKRKESAPQGKFFPFTVDSFSKGRQTIWQSSLHWKCIFLP